MEDLEQKLKEGLEALIVLSDIHLSGNEELIKIIE